MATRAMISIYGDNDRKEVLTRIYSHWDGYISGLGKKIYEILKDGQLVNGIGMGMQIPTHFNGMGCLAAYLIGELKGNTIGNVYLFPVSEEEYKEAYNYHIFPSKDEKDIMIAIEDIDDEGMKIFDMVNLPDLNEG